MDEKVRQGWPTGLAPHGYINVDEAVEILMNVRRLAEVLLRAEEEGKKP